MILFLFIDWLTLQFAGGTGRIGVGTMQADHDWGAGGHKLRLGVLRHRLATGFHTYSTAAA